MKVLFWLLAIVSIPVGWFMTAVSLLGGGLGLYGTGLGQVLYVAGVISVLVSIACMVLGILRLRKGQPKKAVIFALAGILYSALVLGGVYVDDALHSVRMDRDIAARNEQLYGENWDAPPAIDGIPKLYQTELNKFYAVVRDRWSSEQLADLSAMAMAEYYGEVSLDSIGFVLMDVNGDGSEELLIGTAAPVAEGGTAFFCMYSDPENPFTNLPSLEGEVYFLHAGETEGTYLTEIAGQTAAWQLAAEEGDVHVNIQYREVTLDPADRLTLELIPFSQYK